MQLSSGYLLLLLKGGNKYRPSGVFELTVVQVCAVFWGKMFANSGLAVGVIFAPAYASERPV